MRSLLISAGDFTFEDAPINKGLIGGKVIATNTLTGEEISRVYNKFHTGKTNKFDVLAKLMYELAPPASPQEDNHPNEEALSNS